MVHVFHLYDRRCDSQTERGVLHLSREPGPGFVAGVRSIGHGGDFRNIAEAVVGLRPMRHDHIDIIHAWSPLAMTAAVLAGYPKIIYSLPVDISSKALNWLNFVLAHKKLDVVCQSDTQRRMCLQRGLPPARCHLIRPGADFSRLKRRRNPELRATLGFTESDYVLLAVGESTHASAHRLALWAAGILHELDRKTRILVWGRGPVADTTHRFARRLKQNGLYTSAQLRLGSAIEFEELTTVADAALLTARGDVATLPICICMAGGLPIVSTMTSTAAELFEDQHTALMVPKPSPRALAERVIDLRQDEALRWRIADNARTEAYEVHSLTRFLDQWRTAYQQVAAGKPLDIPQPVARVHAHG